MLTKLFTPGPVGVNRSVLEELAKPIIFHRTKPFENLYKKVTDKLLKVFDANEQYVSLILTGSGTMANESVLMSLIETKDKILIISNGQFGERLATIAKIHKLDFKLLDFGWGNIVEPNKLEIEMKKNKYKWVVAVLLETSTGMVNPIYKIGKLCERYKSKFMVDAVSGLGAENISMINDSIDVCVSVPNKALESVSGISFVCIKRNLITKLKNNEPKSYYLDLFRYYEISLKNQTPTTPAISVIVSLNKALDLLLKEGLINRQNRYKKLSTLVIKYCDKLDLDILFRNQSFKAKAITTLVLSNHESAEKLQKYLEKYGFILWHHPYHNKDKRFDRLLQISVMGDINKGDIVKLFTKISEFKNLYAEQ